ncbi:uncharacterized phage protein (possible DNA packaging) [Enterococcus faecalis]|uniref:head-tail connector protein n=1 Tax=Enterococcus TaxID=1350 RepID=UPI000534B1C6|nr:head-tail connector protein [Enterococcus faecalis]SDN56717.1 uncharacterized phage protein (possible DNA packaging) [Enterococcus faecalis]
MNTKLLDMLKLSLRIDGDYDDEILKRNIIAASTYLKQAIGEEDSVMADFYSLPEVESLFETALIALASTYYMYRVSVQISSVNSVEPVSRAIIGQLRTVYLMERSKRLEKSES